MYPCANVPVGQMSLNYSKAPQYHYELPKELASLNNKGVLIIGSGHMVHNLVMLTWEKINTDNYGFDWAIETSQKMKNFIINDNHQSLINYKSQGKAFVLAVPSPEHYLPLLYSLELKEDNEKLTFFNDKALAGSLTMTSEKIDTA